MMQWQQQQAAQAARMQMQQQAQQMALMQQMQQMQQPQFAGGVAPSFGVPSQAAAPPTDRQSGTVKKFFEEKGFGFIQCDDRSLSDVFVHFNQVTNGSKEEMREGVRLNFTIVPDDRSGRVAAQSVLIER